MRQRVVVMLVVGKNLLFVPQWNCIGSPTWSGDVDSFLREYAPTEQAMRNPDLLSSVPVHHRARGNFYITCGHEAGHPPTNGTLFTDEWPLITCTMCLRRKPVTVTVTVTVELDDSAERAHTKEMELRKTIGQLRQEIEAYLSVLAAVDRAISLATTPATTSIQVQQMIRQVVLDHGRKLPDPA